MPKHENNITTILGAKGSGKTVLANYLTTECPRLIIWDTLGQFECNDVVNHTVKFEKVLQHSVFNVAVRLPEYYFESICQWVRQTGDCVFVIDEIDMMSTASQVPEDLNKLIRYGRHYVKGENGTHGVDLIATARRAAEVPRALTANSDDIYVYHTHEPRDLTYLSSFMDVEQIKDLAEYECLHYNTRGQKYTRERVPAEFVKE